MNKRWLLIFPLLIAAAAAVYGLSGRGHDFSDDKCVLCHSDVKGDPASLKPTFNLACGTCHMKLGQKKSHPTDIYPSMSVPEDMPLLEGKLTCITCHYVHPEDNNLHLTDSNLFLRRQSRGIFFCTICHKIDKNRHIVFENVHTGTYKVTDRTTRIDSVSLECIECHDTYARSADEPLGAGTWNHNKQEYNHPIGVSYNKITSKKMHQFRPEGTLSRDVRLFNGKIGCGTCHNIYSHEKKMLVINNRGSRLCLVCHIK
ncbi:MAG: cytochrome c3 family protein [Nitrospirota bacterium]